MMDNTQNSSVALTIFLQQCVSNVTAGRQQWNQITMIHNLLTVVCLRWFFVIN